MRTNNDIDDDLLEDARRFASKKTKKGIIHDALKAFISTNKRKKLSELVGKIRFVKAYDYKLTRK